MVRRRCYIKGSLVKEGMSVGHIPLRQVVQQSRASLEAAGRSNATNGQQYGVNVSAV